MQRVILLTENEYTQLKSETPSALMQATIDKLKQSNENLQKQVFELKSELQTYQLAGANKRPVIDDFKTTFMSRYSYIISKYNSLSTPKIKETTYLTSTSLGITPGKIKQILKQGVDNNVIERTKDNKYVTTMP